MTDLRDFVVEQMNTGDYRWLDDAACGEMGWKDFFVDAGHVAVEHTLEVCRRCPVREECLRHAYDKQYTAGYFAGLSPGQRRTLTLAQALEYIERDTPKHAAA